MSNTQKIGAVCFRLPFQFEHRMNGVEKVRIVYRSSWPCVLLVSSQYNLTAFHTHQIVFSNLDFIFCNVNLNIYKRIQNYHREDQMEELLAKRNIVSKSFFNKSVFIHKRVVLFKSFSSNDLYSSVHQGRIHFINGLISRNN